MPNSSRTRLLPKKYRSHPIGFRPFQLEFVVGGDGTRAHHTHIQCTLAHQLEQGLKRNTLDTHAHAMLFCDAVLEKSHAKLFEIQEQEAKRE